MWIKIQLHKITSLSQQKTEEMTTLGWRTSLVWVLSPAGGSDECLDIFRRTVSKKSYIRHLLRGWRCSFFDVCGFFPITLDKFCCKNCIHSIQWQGASQLISTPCKEVFFWDAVLNLLLLLFICCSCILYWKICWITIIFSPCYTQCCRSLPHMALAVPFLGRRDNFFQSFLMWKLFHISEFTCYPAFFGSATSFLVMWGPELHIALKIHWHCRII